MTVIVTVVNSLLQVASELSVTDTCEGGMKNKEIKFVNNWKIPRADQETVITH